MTDWRGGVVRLISVPYTGTNFLAHLLQSNGIPVERQHTYVQGWRRWIATGGHPVVAPMRDPMMHVASCEQRKAKIRVTQFNDLAEAIPPEAVLCIDLNHRQQLTKLGKHLGVWLIDRTGWEPRGTQADPAKGKMHDYVTTGRFEGMEDQVREITPGTRDWLRELGYTMGWLDW